MKEPVKILYITQEIDPYIKETEISEICRRFPQYTQEQGCEIRAFMPCYGHINERRNQLHEVQRLSGMNIIIDDTDHPLIIKVASIPGTRMQVYFIDNEDYYTQRNVYCNDNGEEYPDQVERCLFFAEGIAETVRKLRWTPDIIYCQGWFAAVAPLYFKKAIGDDPCFKNAKIVYGLFNNAYKKPWTEKTSHILKISGVTKNDIAEIKDKQVSHSLLCKFATKFSDGIVITDKDIDPEVLDYVKKSGKTVLDVSDKTEIDAEAYSNFFDSFQ